MAKHTLAELLDWLGFNKPWQKEIEPTSYAEAEFETFEALYRRIRDRDRLGRVRWRYEPLGLESALRILLRPYLEKPAIGEPGYAASKRRREA
jgi:hypothetical protein